MPPRRNQIRLTPSKVLAAMLVFSAAGMVLPRQWSGSDRCKVLAQPLTMLQGAVTGGTSLAAPTPLASRATAAGQPADDAMISRQILEGQVLAMAEEIRSLRRRNADLAGLRGTGYIPRRLGRLMPAAVIRGDSLAYRSVVEIDRGRRDGTTRDQWATSAIYLDRGNTDGLAADRNVFSVESLIGRIVWTGPFTSKVRLLTDPASRATARIVRIQADAIAAAPGTYLLEGTGQGMVIQQVDYRLIDSGQIQVGDLVVLQPTPDLPAEAASLRRAGRITDIRRVVADSPSVCTLAVAPLQDLDTLRHVYVFDPTPVE